MIEDPNDHEKARQKAVEMAKIGPRTGKEEQLKSVLDDIAKYEQKYSSVSTLKDLTKRPPNL